MGSDTLIFKDVTNWPLYEVSNTGIIRNKRTKRELKHQTRNSGGYKSVNLYNKGISRSLYIHRLVALSHVDGHFLFAEVNHKDADKSNNHYSNLEWCTTQENHDHKVDNGLCKGRSDPKSKVAAILTLHDRGFSSREIALMVGLSKTTVLSTIKLNN